MSFFQVRSGGSSYKVRDERGIKRIITLIKLDKGGNRFKNHRFDNIRQHYGVGVQIPTGELNNKMQGTFSVTK